VERDLITALKNETIAGAGLDVFDQEPPPDHPFRAMDNVTLTPHLGYSTHETLAAFYSDSLEAIVAFADGNPVRVSNPVALERART
jgi:phosphoglycerate dehydrogenase-like enzyme